jgi:hypothetical protein
MEFILRKEGEQGRTPVGGEVARSAAGG